MTAYREQILRACYSFLIPVARFLLRSGISFREFAEIGRVAFVQVATEDYGIRGRPTNISRVAAMTGIPRKDVSRVRPLMDDYLKDPRVQLSPLGDVLQRWCTSDEFLDDYEQPRALPFTGDGPTFELLVQRFGGDVPAGAMKVELLRCGAVIEDSDGLLRISRREIVPKEFDERLMTSLAFSLRGLATTIAHNTDPKRKQAGRIERFVQSGPLTVESREALSLVIRDRITTFTESMDGLLSSGEIVGTSEARRIGVGVFYHEDSESS